MNNDKVYTPQVVEDTPFPQELVQSDSISTGTKDVATPATIQDNAFPQNRYAQEVLADSLNTRSKKIMQEFSFTKTGSIKVGSNENGTGEVAISPDGITAIDSDGNPTFTLDGTDGSAYFKGTVEASTLIGGNLLTGEVMVGEADGNAYVKIDGANNRILVHDGTTNRIVIGNV